MLNENLVKVFDMLHKDMTIEELTSFIYAFCNFKLKINNIEHPVKISILNEEEALEHFPTVDELVLENAFVMDFELYLPYKYLTDAIENNDYGRLIHNLAHELEHIFQNYNNIHDETSYNIHFSYEIPFSLREIIIKNSSEKTYNKICDMTEDLIINHYYKKYFSSHIEIKANAMALMYARYFKEYVENQPKGERKTWLTKQVKNIFKFNDSVEKESKYALSSIEKEVTQIKMKTLLLTTLKYVDNSEDARELILRQYDMCKDFEIDPKFRKSFNVLFQCKFFGTLSEKEVNKNIDNLLKYERQKEKVSKDISKIEIEDEKYIDTLTDTYKKVFTGQNQLTDTTETTLFDFEEPV